MSLKISYELGKLKDIVEERHRLVVDLGVAPSKSDSISLKQQLNAVLELLNDNAEPEFREFQEEYNELLDTYLGEDTHIDLELYKFVPVLQKEAVPGHTNEEVKSDEDLLQLDPNQKKVRFNEDLETFSNEEALSPPNEVSSTSMTFQPYHDYEEESGGQTSNKNNSRYYDTRSSNDELFARQQQQLLEQESQIDNLASTVHTTHGISIDINQELTDQNHHVLDDLENLLDSSSRNLDRAQRRLTNFTNKARENGPCSIIVLLTIILIFLLLLL